ncbi:MAG: hypothetical protein LBT49_03090, partial [Prevotellaceae bacterium]|nr:hypothetical protein [Prevotellaceae bacterium]
MRTTLLRTVILGLFLLVNTYIFGQCNLFSSYADTLVIGEEGSGYTLTQQPSTAFTISGTKYNDATGNWLDLPTGGQSSLTITAKAGNPYEIQRACDITLTAGTCTRKIVVIQPGKTCREGIDGTPGTKFWAAFMENMYANTSSTLTTDLVFASLPGASGTITNPITKWQHTFSVPANGIYRTSGQVSRDLQAQAYNTEGEIIHNKAIYIETSANVSVYGLNFQDLTSDAAVILPVEALGDEYYSISYNGNEGRGGTDRTPEEFLIVATENNTLVTIVPTNQTGGTDGTGAGKAPGAPFTIRLHKGQSYLVKSKINVPVKNHYYPSITGSYIKANKLIAVFGGHKRAHVGNGTCESTSNKGQNSRDHLYEQLLPLRLWGTKYLVVPTNLEEDRVRVLAAKDNTQFSINGVPQLPLNRGKSMDFNVGQDDPALIEADQPVSVALFAESMECTSLNIGDPFMLVLNPVQNMTRELTFSPLYSSNISAHYINITVETKSKELTQLIDRDGNKTALTFTNATGNHDYSYAKVPVEVGDAPYSLKNEKGFSAYVYGAGNADSYGYLVGARFNHLQEPTMVH